MENHQKNCQSSSCWAYGQMKILAGIQIPRRFARGFFSRMTMLSRLRYAGITKDDLLTIYKLFIRSTVEYCSVAFHSALTQEQTRKIELIQKTSLKIILGSEYDSYESALSSCSLDTLFKRRGDRMLKFSIKCTQDKFNKKIFPYNTNTKIRNTSQ